MSQPRHNFKERGDEDIWRRLPDNTGKYKEEKCGNCHCIRMTVRYDRSPEIPYHKYKREEGHEYKTTVLKCEDGYKRNYAYFSRENGPAIVVPKIMPALVKQPETIADLQLSESTVECETQARLDEAIILIKLMMDKIDSRWLGATFANEYRIGKRILETNKM